MAALVVIIIIVLLAGIYSRTGRTGNAWFTRQCPQCEGYALSVVRWRGRAGSLDLGKGRATHWRAVTYNKYAVSATISGAGERYQIGPHASVIMNGTKRRSHLK